MQTWKLIAGSVFVLSLAAQTPQWKDGQTEWKMFDSAKNEADARKKLTLIDVWKEKYPDTDYKMVRLQLYLSAYQQLNDMPHLLATLGDMIRLDPKDLTVMSPFMYYAILSNDTGPAALEKAENVAGAALANLDNKPATINEEQWPQAKRQIESLARQALGWVAMQRKQADAAEQEFGRSLAIDPNQAQVDFWLANTLRAAKTPEKTSQALFYYARAATMEGQGELVPQGRQKIDEFLRKAYVSYHGADEAGLNELKALAKAQATPPADFKIKAAGEIALEKQQQFQKDNPQLALWLNVKRELTAADGARYFESSMKGALVQGLKGRLISAKPAVRAKELVVGLADPNTPEVTLKLDAPLKGQSEPGCDIEFEGVPSAFQPDPFMVTFDVEAAKIKGLKVHSVPAGGTQVRKKKPV
jgi:tetratricopeptide (TPR) repeat protein